MIIPACYVLLRPNFVSLNHSIMKRLQSLLKGKCPCCYRGDVFEKPLTVFGIKIAEMNKTCSNCGHVYEKEVGFFWGSMFASYALTVAEAIMVFCIGQLFFVQRYDDKLIWLIAFTILLLIRFNFRYSRLMWIYIFTSQDYDV
jgi:uncharacterized protein (DUF983 family)